MSKDTTQKPLVQLPEYGEMAARLATVNDDPYINERFHPFILKSAGKELYGEGIFLMLHLAIHDYSDGAPPMMAAILQMSIKDYIKALIDDEEIQAATLEHVDRVEADVKRQRDTRPPAPARQELSEDDKSSLMRSIKRLAEVFDECTNDPSRNSDRYRADGVNPFYNQVQTGLYLEFYYGTPSKVWTPWGYWHFGAAQPAETNIDMFMSRLTVREHAEVRHTNQGVIGPVYALLAIDGVALPEPSLLDDQRQFMSFQDANAEWNQLFEAN